MNKSNSARKSRSRTTLIIGVVFVLAAIFMNWRAITFRHQNIAHAEALQVEIDALSMQVDADQKIQNELPQKRKLAAKRVQDLNRIFDLFELDQHRDGLPAMFLPDDSEYLYVCDWTDYQTMEVFGRLYVPDNTKHRLVFYLSRLFDKSNPSTEQELKFDCQGPGWIHFGWQPVQNGDEWELQFHCDGSEKRIVPLPQIEDLSIGGQYGDHQELVKNRFVSQDGWEQSQRTRLPEYLADNWLIMFPIQYAFDDERGSRAEVKHQIFICLESDQPIYFSKDNYSRLQRDGDERCQKMKLDPETGLYRFDPGK